jgi:hypothetical protein
VKQALSFQMQADSFQRVVELYTQSLATAEEGQKPNIRIAVRDNDRQAVSMRKKADEWLVKVAGYENGTQVVNRESKVVTNQGNATGQENVLSAPATAVSHSKGNGDSVNEEFAVLVKSPYTAENPIPFNHALPGGIVYKIQLGAFSKPVVPDTFKGLTPVSGEKMANGIVRYYVGVFRRYTGAELALQKIREYGYKDAYIVAFHDRKPVTVEQARKLEGDISNK